MEKEIRLQAGSDERSKVELIAWLTCNGIVVLLQGGEEPHVGAVVLTVPRPSLTGEEKTSCNSWVAPVSGHKDDEIAKPAAEMIASATGKVTVVVAGIHIHAAKTEEIARFLTNCNRLVQKFIKTITMS